MDRPAIHAAEAFVHAGYPLDVEALLIVELDGPEAECDHLMDEVRDDRPGQRRRCPAGSRQPKTSAWPSGPGARRPFPPWAASRPDYYCMDGTIPRRRLPEVLQRMKALSSRHGLERGQCLPRRRRQSASADPVRRQPAGQLDRAEAFGADILRLCVEVGGVLTGEHGVGVEKRDLMPVMFTEADLSAPAKDQVRL